MEQRGPRGMVDRGLQRHTINASYHCERAKIGERANPDGKLKIFNSGSYLLAEYSERTGEAKWHRVIPAEQRNMIERWLRQNFPIDPARIAAHL